MHFPLVRRHNRLRRDFRVLPVASISLALSQLSPTYIYIYIYIPIYSRSVPPVRFTAFPPRCIHKTNPNSHGVVLMPGERMRNAYACTARIPVATGSMSSLCPCVNTRPRALSLSRATRARVAFVRGYGLEGCVLRGVVGIPQAVAFLPTFRGVKMCPRRAGRVGNCFAPPIPALVPRDPSRLPSRPFRYGKGDGIKSFPANERFFLSVSSSLFFFFFFASHLFFLQFDLPLPLPFFQFRGRDDLAVARRAKWKNTRMPLRVRFAYESAFSPSPLHSRRCLWNFLALCVDSSSFFPLFLSFFFFSNWKHTTLGLKAGTFAWDGLFELVLFPLLLLMNVVCVCLEKWLLRLHFASSL